MFEYKKCHMWFLIYFYERKVNIIYIFDNVFNNNYANN